MRLQPPSEDVLAEFSTIVGPANVLKAGADMAAYETGARNDQGKAAFVVRPDSTEQVSKVMALAARHHISLVPQSGNTGLVSGSTPDATGLQGVLSLDRMRKVLALDCGNRTADVEAGVRLSQLNDVAGEHGLFFPIDLGADPMIGGMVATNTGGARFLRYGDVRRNTLGLEVVLPDKNGTVLRLGGALRKNNTGVDFKQLFVGTCGAYGVITRVTIELHRKPRQTAAALLVPKNDEAVIALLETFEELAGESLSAFEAMSREAMEAAFRHAPSLRNPFANGNIPEQAILVELSRAAIPLDGGAALEADLEVILGSIWEREDGILIDALPGRPEALWALRHALSEGVKAAGQIIAFDLSFRRSDLPRFRTDMRRLLMDRFPRLKVCDFGHVGDGGVHFNCVHPLGDEGPLPASAVMELRSLVIEEVVQRFGGSFSAEHAIGRSNQAFYDRYTDEMTKCLASNLLTVLTDEAQTTSFLGAARFGFAA